MTAAAREAAWPGRRRRSRPQSRPASQRNRGDRVFVRTKGPAKKAG
jgi:hypothetical protein